MILLSGRHCNLRKFLAVTNIHHCMAFRFDQHPVNFINVKRTNFLYERHFGSFFLVTCTYIVKAAKTTSVQKIVRLMLMKLTPRVTSSVKTCKDLVNLISKWGKNKQSCNSFVCFLGKRCANLRRKWRWWDIDFKKLDRKQTLTPFCSMTPSQSTESPWGCMRVEINVGENRKWKGENCVESFAR